MNSNRKQNKALIEPVNSLEPQVIEPLMNFIKDNSSFQSSKLYEKLEERMVKTKSFREIFQIPIEARLFNMDVALLWLVMVSAAHEKESIVFSSNNTFNIKESLKYISDVYDIEYSLNINSYYESSTETSDVEN